MSRLVSPGRLLASLFLLSSCGTSQSDSEDSGDNGNPSPPRFDCRAPSCLGCSPSASENPASICTEVPVLWEVVWSGPALLESLWASSSTDVFAAGQVDIDPDDFDEGPIILHFDGDTWVEQPLPATTYDPPIQKIHGSNPDNVVAIRFGGTNEPLRYNRGTWENFQPIAAGGTTVGLWTWSILDHTVSATGGSILHFDGGEWSLQREGLPYVQNVPTTNALWGSAPEDMFAVGEDGSISHFDGSAWAPQESGIVPDPNSGEDDLVEVWGTGPTDVYAVSHFGANIVHYDGAAWSGFEVPVPGEYTQIAASEPSRVYATGILPLRWVPTSDPDNEICLLDSAPLVARYDGTTWSCAWLEDTTSISDVRVTDTDVFAVGSRGAEGAIFRLATP